MNIKSFNPYLLHMNHQSYCDLYGNEYQPFPTRITRFHELDVITFGKGRVNIDGIDYSVDTGDVFYRCPNMLNTHYRPYFCYFFIFDPEYSEARENMYADKSLYFDENISEPIRPLSWQPAPIFDFSKCPKLGKLRDIESVMHMLIELQYLWSAPVRDDLAIKKVFFDVLVEIRSQLIEQENCHKLPEKYEKDLMDLCSHIRANPLEDYSIDKLSGMIRVSPNFFNSLFKRSIGVTPMQFVRNIRLNLMKLLLIDTNMNIKEIATLCRFDDPNYFSAFFKKYTGRSPSEYRANFVK